jgi:3-hydroxyacyl-CoA dehydrogenase/enoyl-CoA hydratase/3-hydroxybutyryl-CoA epimerase
MIPEYLYLMVEAGRLGKKTGSGFYLYDQRGQRLHRGMRPVSEFATSLQRANGRPLKLRLRSEVSRRLSDLLTEEADRCLLEGIAEGPEEIDFAMVMGTGYAPFRGGPIAWGEKLRNAKHAENYEQKGIQL